mgnify:CR=1 FL=1
MLALIRNQVGLRYITAIALHIDHELRRILQLYNLIQLLYRTTREDVVVAAQVLELPECSHHIMTVLLVAKGAKLWKCAYRHVFGGRPISFSFLSQYRHSSSLAM